MCPLCPGRGFLYPRVPLPWPPAFQPCSSGRGNALGNQSKRAPVLILSPRRRHQPGRQFREGPSQSPSILRPLSLWTL